MKKWISVMLLLVLMLGCTSAVAAKKQAVIPDFCNPILERWGATNEKELQQAILTYWEENNPKEWPSIHKNVKTPVSFQFGGTTKELIATHNDWDVAIVSSKNVDLQKLADAGCLVRREGHPLERYALHQWLLPEAVQNMLPKHPLYYYAVYCYSYNATNNEALFVISNTKGRKNRRYDPWAFMLLQKRSTAQVREVEGISRTFDWATFEMSELSYTEDELIEHADAWDWAFLRINYQDKLEKLDAAGLLYDFSQKNDWISRKTKWKTGEPTAIFSNDGRMIAIPYPERIYNGSNEISVFVINAKSPVLDRTLDYAEHFIKSQEWISSLDTSYNPELDKLYGEGSLGILKDDVDW